MSPTGDLLVTSIFLGEVSPRACSGAFMCCTGMAQSQGQHTLWGNKIVYCGCCPLRLPLGACPVLFVCLLGPALSSSFASWGMPCPLRLPLGDLFWPPLCSQAPGRRFSLAVSEIALQWPELAPSLMNLAQLNESVLGIVFLCTTRVMAHE